MSGGYEDGNHQKTSVKISNDKRRKKRTQLSPIRKKESYRWIASYKNACELAAHLPDKKVISMGDRECDFYDFYTIAKESIDGGKPYADWIVRGTWDRETEAQDAQESTIIQEVKDEAVMATVEFMMPSREGKPARLVQQEI